MSCRQAVCMRCMDSSVHVQHSILSMRNAQQQLDLQQDSISDRLAHMQSALSTQQNALFSARCVHETKLAEFAALVVQLRNVLRQRVDEFATALLADSTRLSSVAERRVENSLLVNAERTRECLRAQRTLAHVDKATVTGRARAMKQFNGMLDESAQQSPSTPGKEAKLGFVNDSGELGNDEEDSGQCGSFPEFADLISRHQVTLSGRLHSAIEELLRHVRDLQVVKPTDRSSRTTRKLSTVSKRNPPRLTTLLPAIQSISQAAQLAIRLATPGTLLCCGQLKLASCTGVYLGLNNKTCYELQIGN